MHRSLFAFWVMILISSPLLIAQPASEHSLHLHSFDSEVQIFQEKQIPFSGTVSIEFWIKPTDLTDRYVVLSTAFSQLGFAPRAGGFQIEIGKGQNGTGTNRISVTGYAVSGGGFDGLGEETTKLTVYESASNVIKGNQWNHITYVRTGSLAGQQKMYVNGIELTPESRSDYIIEEARATVFIAKGKELGFVGYLDELRFWNKARTVEEISSTFYNSLSGDESGLTGYWDMNEGSGSRLNDKSTYGNNGLLMNNAGWSRMVPLVQFFEPRSIALTPPGVVNVPQTRAIDFTRPFTVEFWVKPNDLSSRKPIFSTRKEDLPGAFEIEVGTGMSGTHRVTVTGPGTFIFDSPDNTVLPNQWQHIAYVRTGNSAADQTMYVNGDPVSPNHTENFTITNNSNDFRLGSNFKAGQKLDGNLFELRIWEKALTKQEIRDKMAEPLDGDETGLAGYWPLNQGLGTTIYDMSSRRNNGTIDSNVSWSTDVPASLVPGVSGIDFSSVDGKNSTSTITTDIILAGIRLSPVSLTLKFDESANRYSIYGSVSFPFMEQDVSATIGDAANPGFVLENGQIKQVALSITEDFKMAGLQINTNNLGMEWTTTSGINEYHIYGDADIFVEGSDLDADFGTINNAGMILRGNGLHRFRVDINSDIKLGNAEFKTKNLTINYETFRDKIEVWGAAEFSEVFDAEVIFGDGDNEGLEIDVSGTEPRFKIDALTVEVDHLNLGAVDLKKLKLAFDANGLKETDVVIVFGGSDEIGADLKFDDGDPIRLQSIDIDYRADNLEEGLEIFEGVQIAFMDANVTNIDHPHNLKVVGDVQLYVGEGLSLDGVSATMLETGAKVTVDRKEVEFDVDVNMGAYRDGDSNDWNNILGTASGSFGVYFQKKAVKATLSSQLPGGESFVEFDEKIWIGKHDLAFLADVKLFVPSNWPIIGGKTLASVDGALYDYRLPYKSGGETRYKGGGYAAGWTKVLGHTVGGKYDFNSGKINTFGSGGAKAIKADWDNATKAVAIGSSTTYLNTTHTFEIVHPAPNSAMVDLRWHQPIDSVLVTVIGPEGFYEATHVYITSQNDEQTMPDIATARNLDLVTNDSSAIFLISTPSQHGADNPIEPTMTAGRYQVVLSYPSERPDSSSIAVYQRWQEPEIELEAVRTDQNSYTLNARIRTALQDSTVLSFYVTDTTSNNSGKLIEHIIPENYDFDHLALESITYAPDFVPDHDSLYFYAVIQDGINVPVKTPLTPALEHAHDISGTITFPSGADSLRSGLRVFLDLDDDGSFDIESTGGLEPYAISHDDGEYHLLELPRGEYLLRVVLPRGYRITGTEDRFGAVPVTFTGEPVTRDLTIEPYTEN